jgi:hypothetical protein
MCGRPWGGAHQGPLAVSPVGVAPAVRRRPPPVDDGQRGRAGHAAGACGRGRRRGGRRLPPGRRGSGCTRVLGRCWAPRARVPERAGLSEEPRRCCYVIAPPQRLPELPSRRPSEGCRHAAHDMHTPVRISLPVQAAPRRTPRPGAPPLSAHQPRPLVATPPAQPLARGQRAGCLARAWPALHGLARAAARNALRVRRLPRRGQRLRAAPHERVHLRARGRRRLCSAQQPHHSRVVPPRTRPLLGLIHTTLLLYKFTIFNLIM